MTQKTETAVCRCGEIIIPMDKKRPDGGEMWKTPLGNIRRGKHWHEPAPAVPQAQMKEFLSVCDDPNCNHPYCWSQRPADPPIPREKRLEDALRGLVKIVVELYPGHVEPDGEHLGEYQAVWSAVFEARAALEDK